MRFCEAFSETALGGACLALVPGGISLDSDDVPDALCLFLFASNRGCGYGCAEDEVWVEDEEGATKRGAAVTSDDLPDVCFFGGGGNGAWSRDDPDPVEPNDLPGPGVKVKGGRGEDANGFLFCEPPCEPFLSDDLPDMAGTH